MPLKMYNIIANGILLPENSSKGQRNDSFEVPNSVERDGPITWIPVRKGNIDNTQRIVECCRGVKTTLIRGVER